MIGRDTKHRRERGSRVLASVTATLAQTATPGPVRRVALSILGIIGAVAFVLGFIGWSSVARHDPSMGLDGIGILYRTVQLFIGEDGGLFSVPWTLDVARIVAPLIIPLLGSVAILGFAAKPLNRLGARTAVRHTIVVGPAERAQVYVSGEQSVESIEVHADVADSPTLIGPLHIQVDLGDPAWLQRTNAAAARRIVIATGRDDTNMVVLDQVLTDPSTAEILVETSGPDTQRWLALAVAETHPDADVQVLCIEASQRQSVVERVLSTSPLGTDPTAPCAVIGDAADIDQLAAELARELASGHTAIVEAAHDRDPHTSLGSSRCFYVVDAPDPEVLGELLSTQLESLAGVLHLFVGTHSPEQLIRVTNLVALVAYADSETAMRVAAQLGASRPDITVFVRSTELSGSPLPRVEVIGDDHATPSAGSPDPIVRFAELLHEVKNPVDSPTQWSSLRRDVRRHLIRDAKRLLTSLPTIGFAVGLGHATDDADLPHDDELVDLARLVAGPLSSTEPNDAAREDAANLPHVLGKVGLRLVRHTEDTALAIGDPAAAIDVLPGPVVDRLAEIVHVLYLDDLETVGRLADDNSSHVPWDDLPVQVKLQNAHHLLHAVATLNRLGLRVSDRPIEGTEPLADLSTETIEDWAQREHNRWMTQKLAQGWVYGSEDAPDAEPRTHPDLIAWDALDEMSRDKHRRPIARLPQILHAGGYAILAPVPPTVDPELTLAP